MRETSRDTTTTIQQDSAGNSAMFAIEGMTKVAGVKDPKLNLATEPGSGLYDPSQTGPEQMVQKVEAVGYKATPQVSLPQHVTDEHSVTAPPDLPVMNAQ